VDDEHAAELESALRSLEADQGLAILVKRAGAESAETTGRAAGRLLALELVGTDRPGIVREISQALASKGVNVEELHTECTSAPMSGETLFRARALLRLPGGAEEDDLQAGIEAIAEDLMVDVTFEPAASDHASGEPSFKRNRLRRA
jgi:glycine cleavage system regulatory protein